MMYNIILEFICLISHVLGSQIHNYDIMKITNNNTNDNVTLPIFIVSIFGVVIGNILLFCICKYFWSGLDD